MINVIIHDGIITFNGYKDFLKTFVLFITVVLVFGFGLGYTTNAIFNGYRVVKCESLNDELRKENDRLKSIECKKCVPCEALGLRNKHANI